MFNTYKIRLVVLILAAIFISACTSGDPDADVDADVDLDLDLDLDADADADVDVDVDVEPDCSPDADAPGLMGESIIWADQIGTCGSEKWAEVEVDSADQIIVGGYAGGSFDESSQGGLDSLLAKYSSDGQLTWIRQFGTIEDDKITALTVDRADDILVVGWTEGSFAADHQGSIDGVLAKYSADGEQLWIKQLELSTPEWDYPSGVSVDSANNIFVVGYTEGSLASASAGFRDYFLVKFSADGQLLWRRQYGGPELDAAYSIDVDSAGNALIGGFTRNSLEGVNQGASDAFVAKYSSEGDRIWVRQIGTSKTEGVSGLAIDSNDNIAIGGRTSGSLGGTYLGTVDTFVAQFSSDGELLWSRQLASTKFERLYDLAVDVADDILVVGHTDGILGTDIGENEKFPDDPYKAQDGFVAKYTPDGEPVWIRQFGSSGLEGIYGVAADSDQDVIVVGTTTGSAAAENEGLLDALLVKFGP
jgi:hypothetical protein